jgi:TolA-binding protein
MLKFKSTLNLVTMLAAVLGLILVIGCAGSAEKQEMSKILKLYSDAVSDYEAADVAQRAELKDKIDSYQHKCSAMISEFELNAKLTPQVINELEREYKEITKKYSSLKS